MLISVGANDAAKSLALVGGQRKRAKEVNVREHEVCVFFRNKDGGDPEGT